MTLLSLFLFALFAIANARFNCATPEDFRIYNPSLHTEDYKNYIKKNRIPLYRFLFEKGEKLGMGAFGEVRAAAGIKPRLVMKKVFSTNRNVLNAMKREIELLKELCGKEPGETYEDLFECESTAIAGFKGCVEKGDEIYIFQEAMTMDLKSARAKKLYRALEGGEKATVMVDLIRKFQQIHDKGIIHSDIKPENIMMKTKDFSDLRVVDFGLSNKKDQKIVGGSPIYLAPETHRAPYLTCGGDIYSLALTFAMMEAAAEKKIFSMKSICFTSYPNDDCKKNFQAAIKTAFSKETKTDFLLDVFLRATDYDPTIRYTSMKDFADAIAGNAKDVPEFGGSLEGKPKALLESLQTLLKKSAVLLKTPKVLLQKPQAPLKYPRKYTRRPYNVKKGLLIV